MTKQPKTNLTDAEKLRRLRKLCENPNVEATLAAFDLVITCPPNVTVDDLVREGIIPKPRKRKAKR